VGDSWKIKPNLTATLGLRYVRDTGRTDSDLGPIAELNQFNNQFYSGLGDRVNNPNTNFAPQLGIAWDPWKNGRTVLRGGIGLFYENSIFNNVLFDRPGRLTNGTFLAIVPACSNGGAVPVSVPNGPTVTPSFCGQPIGQVQAQIASLQSQFQTAAQAVGSGSNPTFIGSTLADGTNITGTNLFAPNYKTPRSVQMNFGIQREIHRGTVFTADYLRNISTHTLLAVDTNLVGDTRFFNLANAQKAIAATLASCGVASINAAISSCPGLHPTGGGATIADFATNGLDDGYSLCAGFACPTAAFPGINPNLGSNQMLFPVGRSVYNGLQASLRQDLHNPFKGIPYLNLQVSYALSRYVAQAQDGDFINNAFDNANPGKYIGPSGLDRTHQISFGGTMQLPGNFAASVIGHFYSSLPVTLTIGTTGLPGGIFQTAVNGDGEGDGALASGANGTLGGVLPGTNLGSFGRGVNPDNLNSVIGNYNSTYAGNPTPAGQVLINNSLFTLAQLQKLGGVMPAINPAPANGASDGWLRDMDLSFNWTYKVKERVQLQPGVGFFNIMNFVNFDPPKNTLGGVLSIAGTPSVVGTANGTRGQQPNSLRYVLGSGVFGLGAPRVLEFSLKLSF
jgi:hypothetical protein